MTILLNGEEREFSGTVMSVAELIQTLELGSQPVLVELNGEALYEREFSEKVVSQGSKVEIVRMVAGG